jgi:hypothetical protein
MRILLRLNTVPLTWTTTARTNAQTGCHLAGLDERTEIEQKPVRAARSRKRNAAKCRLPRSEAGGRNALPKREICTPLVFTKLTLSCDAK